MTFVLLVLAAGILVVLAHTRTSAISLNKSGMKPDEIRAAIVNPARLSPEREMEVCMQCHLETTSRLLPHSIKRLHRRPFSYVDQPLAGLRLQPCSGKEH